MNSKTQVNQSMWQIIFSVLSAGLFLGLSSCCTKKECNGFDGMNEIVLRNFTLDEVDSIALEIFESNSNFTSRIDSSFTIGHSGSITDDDFNIYMSENLNKSHDYKITVISTGQFYTASSFETKKETCNTCFPYHPSSDYYNILDSYFVNGQKQSGSDVIVSK